jgi:glyoxylase-like metal-dependent hydrolase (beta-lactamase superfamily II)
MPVDNVLTAFDAQIPAARNVALPMVRFDSEVRFNLNGDSLDVIYVPNAHTDGDSIVHFTSANVIHTGDVFFNGFFPFIDTDHGGSLAGMIAAADDILALADDQTKIIPGHGALASKVELQAFRDMLSQAHEKLTTLIESGKSLEEVSQMQPLGELDEHWGQVIFNADKWTQLMYEDMAKN